MGRLIVALSPRRPSEGISEEDLDVKPGNWSNTEKASKSNFRENDGATESNTLLLEMAFGWTRVLKPHVARLFTRT